jgi:hypothetical protein
MSSERVQTRRSSKRQAPLVSESNGTKEVELPPVLEPPSSSGHKAKARHELDHDLGAEIDPFTTSPTKPGPPLLEAEQTVLVDGSSNAFSVSPPFDEEEIKLEMAQKESPSVVRQLENVVKIPIIYYSIREYAAHKKGNLDNLVQLIREHEPGYTITRRNVQDHISRNMVDLNAG